MGTCLWTLALAATAALGCTPVERIWIPRSKTADPLYRFEKGDKVGYIARNGAIVIPPVLSGGSEFHDGLMELDAASGRYIDATGKLVSRPVRDSPGDDVSEGMTRVVLERPCGYLPDGPCGSNPVFVGGLVANAPACKFAFMDQDRKVIPAGGFDFARSFAEGLAPVKKEGRWGYIDKTGKLVVGYQYEDAASFSDGLARVRLNGSYGYIDHRGKLVIPPWFEYADDFSDGLAPVSDSDDGYWYIDKTGRDVFPHRYAEASPFFKGLAHVQLLDENQDASDTFAYIDTSGRKVFEYRR